MRLALDAMGGDNAPAAMVEGAVAYAREKPGHSVLLVGQPDKIQPELHKWGSIPDNVHIHEADEVIGMADKISALKEKPDDSMNACARLVKSGEADAMVLCGNTGCSVGAAQLHLRRIKGVKRAGILVPLPNVKSSTYLIDAGANAVGKPEHLAQFADLASVFLTAYLDKGVPKCGLLSIGSEDAKGDDLTAATLELLKQNENLNFVGNVEGNHIFDGKIDLVVCDGFTGNVVLKTAEGIASAVTTILKEGIEQSFIRKIGALLMRGAFTHLRNRTSWRVVGGSLLLGTNGIVIIGHGRSTGEAVVSALKQAARCVEADVLTKMQEAMAATPTAPQGRKASFYDSVLSFFGGKGSKDGKDGDSADDLEPPPERSSSKRLKKATEDDTKPDA